MSSAAEDLGQGLITASIAVLSVRPTSGPVEQGQRRQSYRAGRNSTHARQPDAAFPFYMALPCIPICRRSQVLFSRRRAAPYIFLRSRRAIAMPTYQLFVDAHVERGL